MAQGGDTLLPPSITECLSTPLVHLSLLRVRNELAPGRKILTDMRRDCNFIAIFLSEFYDPHRRFVSIYSPLLFRGMRSHGLFTHDRQKGTGLPFALNCGRPSDWNATSLQSTTQPKPLVALRLRLHCGGVGRVGMQEGTPKGAGLLRTSFGLPLG